MSFSLCFFTTALLAVTKQKIECLLYLNLIFPNLEDCCTAHLPLFCLTQTLFPMNTFTLIKWLTPLYSRTVSQTPLVHPHTNKMVNTLVHAVSTWSPISKHTYILVFVNGLSFNSVLCKALVSLPFVSIIAKPFQAFSVYYFDYVFWFACFILFADHLITFLDYWLQVCTSAWLFLRKLTELHMHPV